MSQRVRWELLLIPPLLFFFLFFVAPQVVFVAHSFFEHVGRAAVGGALTLNNYGTVLSDSFYLRILWNTFRMSLATVVITLVISFPMAYFLARARSRWGVIVLTLLTLSALTSLVVRGLGLLAFLGENGPFNQLLLSLGLISSPLELTGNMVGAVIGLVHFMIPYATLILVPVIQAIPFSLEEAASGLGASGIYTFRRILIPLALPGLLASFILVFSLSMGAFTNPSILGGARLGIVSRLIYQQSVGGVFNYAMAATLAFILMVMTLALVYLANHVTRDRAEAT